MDRLVHATGGEERKFVGPCKCGTGSPGTAVSPPARPLGGATSSLVALGDGPSAGDEGKKRVRVGLQGEQGRGLVCVPVNPRKSVGT